MIPRLTALLLSLATTGVDAERTGVELPDGAAARAWAGVGPETEAAGLPRLADLAQDAWGRASTWRLWGELVRGERDAPGDPDRRAALALLARLQGRPADAWHHFESLTGSPDRAAAVMPFLLPGAPAGSAVRAGGLPADLPDGVVLRPLLPPAEGGGMAGRIQWREATVHGLRIGDAELALKVSVESTGVQVDIDHVAGGSARLAVLLPEPAGFEIRVEYTDWMRQETLREPLALEVHPGDETHSLYGRFLERREELPTDPGGHMPAQLALGGLWLQLDADDAGDGLLDTVAEVLGELLSIEVRTVAGEGEDERWTGTVVRMSSGDGREERLRYLAAMVEGYLLVPE